MSTNVVRLQNDRVRFSFDRRTGSLLQIENRRTRQKHLADPKRARLFRVMCPNALWHSRYADSHEAPAPEWEIEANRLTIRYRALQAMDSAAAITATVRVELPANQSEALFTLEIANHSADRLQEVRFPWVGGWTGFAGRGQDRAHCGVLPVDPYPPIPELFAYTLLGLHRRQFHIYNCGMLLPFFDLAGGGRGLSYICYQERPNLGGMVLENLDPEPEALSLSFAWVHFPFVKPGQTWRSPTIGLGVHEGDWRATADRFRAWLDTWWQPPRPPERLRRSIGFQVIQVRVFDGAPVHRWREVPRLAAEGRRYGVADLCLWDPIAGVYLRPDDGDFWEEFDPAQSVDELSAALAKTKRAGTNASVLVNYRLIRGNSTLYRRIGDAQVQRTSFGSPFIEEWSNCSSFHAAFHTNYLGREGYTLCQKSAPFRERALAITRRTLALGFTSLFIDQAFDYNPCLAEDHGHRLPDDTHEAAVEWGAQAARLVRERDPEAYVMGEVTDVFGMQHIDLSWYWNWNTAAPEVIRYTLPETLHCWVVDHQPSMLNRAFALGFQVAFTTAQAEQSLARYPAFGARVAQLARLRRRCAEFVVDGRFRDRIGLETGGATAYVYASAKGLAVIVAELGNRPQSVGLTLDPARLGYSPARGGTLHSQNGTHAPAGRVLRDGRIRLQTKLPALGVAVWTVPCQRVEDHP